MKKLVLLAAMLLVSQCWADPVHRSYLSDACVPDQAPEIGDTEDNPTPPLIRADDPVLNQMVQEELLQLQVLAMIRDVRNLPRTQSERTEPTPIILDPGFGLGSM